MWQQTQGIVLRTVKYKDTALMATVYTEAAGRVSFRVPVGRGRRSAVRSSLFQPLALVEVEADFRRTSAVSGVREVRVFQPFATLPFHPYKSAIAFFLAEFLYGSLREEVENRPLFAYLCRAIVWLDRCPQGFGNFPLVFLMRLSRFLGLQPNLEGYEEGDYFDLRNACFTRVRPSGHGDWLPPHEAGRLAQLVRMNFGTMHLFRLTRTERARCLEVILAYYRLHLPDFRLPQSVEVLKELFDA